MKLLCLMVGIPGSGKTTIRNHLENVEIVCPDDLIGYSEDDKWTPYKARYAWQQSDKKLLELLKKDEDSIIVFDATFVKPKKRRKYIRLANLHYAKTCAIYCKIDLDIAIERNKLRYKYRKVPLNVIKNMWEKLTPPSREEGFDYVVNCNVDTKLNKISSLIKSLK